MRFLKNHKNVLLPAMVILVVALVISRANGPETDEPVAEEPEPVVTLATPDQLMQEERIRVIGTVQAVGEGVITAQTGGRIARINVADGDRVTAGSLLLELDNQRQRNAVSQAEANVRQAEAGITSADAGAAERAVAIREAEAGVDAALNQAEAVLQTTINSTKRIVANDIDPQYSSPDRGVPGVRVGTGGIVQDLNEQRTALRELLPTWQQTVAQLGSTAEDHKTTLLQSRDNVRQVRQLIDTMITAVENERNSDLALETQLRSRRDELVALGNELSGARDMIISAEERLERARISDIDSNQEQALAAVAQAQAALEQARIELSETQLRAPVSGVVTNFDATIGAVVAGGTDLGRVIGTETFEIEVFLSQRERRNISVGDTVSVGQDGSGTVSRIAPSIDPTTRKVRVIVVTDTSDLTVGDSISVGFTIQSSVTSEELRVPLTAIQFRAGAGSVLIVNDESRLESVPVTLGDTRGSTITILNGLDPQQPIVVDSRGLRVGTRVQVAQN